MWVDTRSDLVGELFAVVGRFRRQLRRSTGGGFDRTGLTQSQAELLRLVGRRPDISVREAAAELGLAANTASTLVSRLAADDLLTRTVDSADRRVGRLRLTEAAQDLGASPLAAFWRVTFPLSLPGVAAGALLCFIPMVGEFVIPDLLGGSGALMLGRTIWTEFFANRDWPAASAVAIVLLATLVIPIVLFERQQAKVVR